MRELGGGAVERDVAVLEEDHAVEAVDVREVMRDHDERVVLGRKKGPSGR